MNPVRPGDPGATRTCPHCRETILESAMVCPACRHYLHYGANTDAPSVAVLTPLLIEGNIRHPPNAEPWEYTVVVAIRDDLGVEIARKLIGVGARHCGCGGAVLNSRGLCWSVVPDGFLRFGNGYWGRRGRRIFFPECHGVVLS